MTDDLRDIDPSVVESVLNHASEFISADQDIDAIVDWGKHELEALEKRFVASPAPTMQDFKDAAEKIKSEVVSKLKLLEEKLQSTMDSAT